MGPCPLGCRLHRARSATRSKLSSQALRGSGRSAGRVDESATGSVNSWSDTGFRRAEVGSPSMHLRAPSIDQGVEAFVWSVVFFLYMWLGALAVDVPGALAFVVALVAAAAIFVLIRLRGGQSPR